MAFLGVVDAAVMGGTANYEEAFCNPLFLQTHPEKTKLVDKLQVRLVDAATVGFVRLTQFF